MKYLITKTHAAALSSSMAVFLFGLMMINSGCRLLQSAADVPGQAVRAVTPGAKKETAPDPIDVQQAVLRFADGFLTRMVIGLNQLEENTEAPDVKKFLQTKLAFGSETTSIVSGSNAYASLLDLTVFVTATRMALETHWVPNVYGEAAGPLLESCQDSETEIWQFAGGILTEEQQSVLRSDIVAWFQSHPVPESLVISRATGISEHVTGANNADPSSPSNIFGALMLDPLSGLDPAVHEITQTRLFAERALYVAQKMPTLMRWQIELFSLNTAELPEVVQLVESTTGITESVERFATVAEALPDRITEEREAILQALEAQESALRPLVEDVGQTLDSGTEMSNSLNETIATLDALMKRFGVGEPKPEPAAGEAKPDKRPFDILDYAETAKQLAAASQELNGLLVEINTTLDSPALSAKLEEVGIVTDTASRDIKSVLNHAFLLAAGIVLLIFICALIVKRIPRSQKN